ncbi:MAG: hypothetical protein P8Y99_16480 [Calditrichaceae bacterium]
MNIPLNIHKLAIVILVGSMIFAVVAISDDGTGSDHTSFIMSPSSAEKAPNTILTCIILLTIWASRLPMYCFGLLLS